MVYLTRRETFNAAHRLFKPEWTDEKNLEFFGKCSNPGWHGHNYILYVTVRSEPVPEYGLAINIKTLSSIIKKHVTSKIDHMNMNTQVDFMAGRIASTENLAIAIWEVLKPVLKNEGVVLFCVKISETENNFVEYYGKQEEE